MQDHYNLIYREEEREMLPLCADQGVGVIPWSPLARGRLTRPWDTATDADRDRRVRRLALPRRGRRRSWTGCSTIAAARGVAAGPGRPGLAAGPAGGHLADRRRHQARAPHRRGRGGRPRAHRRRAGAALGGLRAARGRRAPLGRPEPLEFHQGPGSAATEPVAFHRRAGQQVRRPGRGSAGAPGRGWRACRPRCGSRRPRPAGSVRGGGGRRSRSACPRRPRGRSRCCC